MSKFTIMILCFIVLYVGAWLLMQGQDRIELNQATIIKNQGKLQDMILAAHPHHKKVRQHMITK